MPAPVRPCRLDLGEHREFVEDPVFLVIGPVADALGAALGVDVVIVSPAFPDTGRTVFQGHLFVGDRLLSESSMRHHPLTPMTDSDVVRLLSAQTSRKVGLVPLDAVAAGPDAIRAALVGLASQGCGYAVVDAVSNANLDAIAAAVHDHRLITGSSGVGRGLPPAWGVEAVMGYPLPPAAGARAVIAGSVSAATNAQVSDALGRGVPGFPVDPLRLAAGEPVVAEVLEALTPRLGRQPVLVYSTAQPGSVAAAQEQAGAREIGGLIEQALADVARGLVDRGVRQLVVAGGETSGAVVQGLGIRRLRIGAEIDPGIPWCYAEAATSTGDGIHLALKSGNFGSEQMFTAAFQQLTGDGPGGGPQ